MDNLERYEAIVKLLKPYEDSLGVKKKQQLEEAFYTLSEIGLIHLDSDDAKTVWAMVELVRNEGFPKELWM